jgi:peptidyl-prolyl cis-trans isomerase A (cyclophilin A)
MTRLLLFALVAAAAFAQSPISAPPASPEQAKGKKNGLYARLVTSMGAITVQLYEMESPETVRSFVGLSLGTKPWKDPKTGQTKTTPLYSGTIFHRVIPGFMIQGGDPAGTGGGDGGFNLPDEWSRSALNFSGPGRLAMANRGAPKSSSVQFFITEAPYESGNQKYTIFGQVVDGQNLVGKIGGVPRNASDRPLTPVVLEKVEIFRIGSEPAGAKK